MKLRYRVLQARWPETAGSPGSGGTGWQNWGFFYQVVDGDGAQRVRFHHNMDELHWIVHHITHRLRSRNLPLSRVEEALAKYSDGFRAPAEIHGYEGRREPLSAAINAVEARVLGLEHIEPHDASEERMRIFAGSANRPLAQAIAHRLGFPLSGVSITSLPDSEVHVQIDETVRKQDVFVIQPCTAPVNDHLVELLLLVDAFRRGSARRVTAVIPYFPYSRQERMARGREAISARVVASMLEMLGADRVIYVHIHSESIQGFFTVPVDQLPAYPTLADYFRGKPFLEDAVIVSPDVGRARLAGKYAQALDVPLVIMEKRRASFEKVETTHVVGDVSGKVPILIDDIVASGSVLRQLPVLFEQGARPEVHLAITHPVLLPTALQELDKDWIAELVVTDTILVPPAKRHPKLKMVSVAPMLSYAIRGIYHGESISPLWQLDAPRRLGFSRFGSG
ncbi:MAG: ribose-phosphate pyrophosphokinase [Chloroflexota bacterium]|nr:ribose-phosphate pyrophosphokinase [Chloroflexota bacterium]